MGIKDIMKKMVDNRNQDVDDDKTTDGYLRFLRRESRRIDEKYEKERLKQKIKEEDQKMLRENVIGNKKSILNAPNMFQSRFKFEKPRKAGPEILKAKNNFRSNKYNIK